MSSFCSSSSETMTISSKPISPLLSNWFESHSVRLDPSSSPPSDPLSSSWSTASWSSSMLQSALFGQDPVYRTWKNSVTLLWKFSSYVKKCKFCYIFCCNEVRLTVPSPIEQLESSEPPSLSLSSSFSISKYFFWIFPSSSLGKIVNQGEYF